MENFRKFLFVCIAISAISFSSCKKEDVLIGTWNLGSSKLEFTSSNPLYSSTLNQFSGDISQYISLPKTLTFSADGTGTYLSPFDNATEVFTYTHTDNKIAFYGVETGIFGMSENFVVDCQFLDKNKTLNMRLDVTDVAKPYLAMIINGFINESPIEIDLSEILETITKVDFTATYNK